VCAAPFFCLFPLTDFPPLDYGFRGSLCGRGIGCICFSLFYFFFPSDLGFFLSELCCRIWFWSPALGWFPFFFGLFLLIAALSSVRGDSFFFNNNELLPPDMFPQNCNLFSRGVFPMLFLSPPLSLPVAGSPFRRLRAGAALSYFFPLPRHGVSVYSCLAPLLLPI